MKKNKKVDKLLRQAIKILCESKVRKVEKLMVVTSEKTGKVLDARIWIEIVNPEKRVFDNEETLYYEPPDYKPKKAKEKTITRLLKCFKEGK